MPEDSTMAEQTRYRKPRNPEIDPNSKATISSILSSPKKKNFTSATFRGLGCTASSQVSVPAVIRTSANWESKKLKKKRLKTKKGSSDKQPNTTSAAIPSSSSSLSLALPSTCVGVPDFWCAPGVGVGLGLTTSVDCVVSRRPPRGKVDGLERIFLAPRDRERSYTVRRMVTPTPTPTPEENPFLEESETAAIGSGATRIRSNVSGHNRHVRHAFREGLAEIVMLQSSILRGGRSDGLDRYRDLRLDVDNMSYEELLELGDRIGYVSTGLGENEINMCLRRTKLAMLGDLSLCFASDMERKCSICQEEYERDDETGKLNCGHFYHLYCIKQWLGQKNACPICKTSAVS